MIKDNSVFIEQIDTALQDMLQNHFKNVYCSRDISIIIRNPEDEFNESNVPCISVNSVLMDTDPLGRKQSITQRTFISEGSVCLAPEIKPADITYHINFWSAFMSDKVKMTLDWLAFFTPSKSFKVLTADGDEVNCYFTTTKTLKETSYTDRGKRVFQSTAIITVHGFVDRFEVVPADIVEQVIFE